MTGHVYYCLQQQRTYFIVAKFCQIGIKVHINIFERRVYRRIFGPVYDNEKENWRILTNKEIYAMVKKTHYNRDNKGKKITLVWACTENGRK